MTFKGVPQLKLVNETIIIMARDSPLSTTSSGFSHTNQCNVNKHFRVSDTRHSGFAMKIGLRSFMQTNYLCVSIHI